MLEAIPLDYVFILLIDQFLAAFIMHVEKDIKRNNVRMLTERER
jgi:hypothetical protein